MHYVNAVGRGDVRCGTAVRSVLPALLGLAVCLALADARANRFVATNGSHSGSFTDWTTAATTIQAAVNAAAAGETIWVSNGTYYVTTAIDIGGSNTLRSVNGPELTIVDGSATTRCFIVHHAGAVVDGFTLTNGVDYTDSLGSGFRIYNGGIIQNCVISGNTAGRGGAGWMQNANAVVQYCIISGNHATASHGGGIYMSDGGGTVRNCIISQNTALNHGGGIYIATKGGIVENCRISDNECGSGGWGGGVLLDGGGVLRNCLIVGNRGLGTGGGVAVKNIGLNGGEVSACTIVSNSSVSWGGGISLHNYMNEDSVMNCIVSSNTGSSYPNVGASGAETNAFRYCCAQFTLAPRPGVGNISEDPQFVNPAGADYRLLPTSPCVNAGTNLPWMDAAVDLDGHARRDRFTRQTDMGCWEYIYSGSVISLR